MPATKSSLDTSRRELNSGRDLTGVHPNDDVRGPIATFLAVATIFVIMIVMFNLLATRQPVLNRATPEPVMPITAPAPAPNPMP